MKGSARTGREAKTEGVIMIKVQIAKAELADARRTGDRAQIRRALANLADAVRAC